MSFIVSVELKGKVACEMGMSELLITEIVMRNILTKLEPPEVASLLSALVSKGKTRDLSEEDIKELPLNLQKVCLLFSAFKLLTINIFQAISELKEIHEEISNLEDEYQINELEFGDKLNFDLALVVYEWASAKVIQSVAKIIFVNAIVCSLLRKS